MFQNVKLYCCLSSCFIRPAHEAQESLHQKEKHNEQIEDFISEIEAMPDSITDFRTDYWGHLVEKVTVHRKGKLVFTFSCGVEIAV